MQPIFSRRLVAANSEHWHSRASVYIGFRGLPYTQIPPGIAMDVVGFSVSILKDPLPTQYSVYVQNLGENRVE